MVNQWKLSQIMKCRKKSLYSNWNCWLTTTMNHHQRPQRKNSFFFSFSVLRLILFFPFSCRSMCKFDENELGREREIEKKFCSRIVVFLLTFACRFWLVQADVICKMQRLALFLVFIIFSVNAQRFESESQSEEVIPLIYILTDKKKNSPFCFVWKRIYQVLK